MKIQRALSGSLGARATGGPRFGEPFQLRPHQVGVGSERAIWPTPAGSQARF
jgi:hypothetical protein